VVDVQQHTLTMQYITQTAIHINHTFTGNHKHLQQKNKFTPRKTTHKAPSHPQISIIHTYIQNKEITTNTETQMRKRTPRHTQSEAQFDANDSV
jgi:hypothetical protein